MTNTAARHPHLPVTGVPDAGMPARLWRDDVWLTADGRVLRPDEIPSMHAWAILGYLRYYGLLLYLREGPTEPLPSARKVQDWVMLLPIWWRLAHELGHRHEVAGYCFTDACYARLAAQGPVPWEVALGASWIASETQTGGS
jgi:hypothetical protein